MRLSSSGDMVFFSSLLVGCFTLLCLTTHWVSGLIDPAASLGRSGVFVDVTILVGGAARAANHALLKMPLVTSNVETVAPALDGLAAIDGKGPLTLTFKDGAEPSPSPYRHWIPVRPTLRVWKRKFWTSPTDGRLRQPAT